MKKTKKQQPLLELNIVEYGWRDHQRHLEEKRREAVQMILGAFFLCVFVAICIGIWKLVTN